jgi:hypothetical protein
MFAPRRPKALISFSDAMGIGNWIFNENWLSDLSVCTWYGVDCDLGGNVVALRMENNGLKQTQNYTDVFDLINPLEHLKVSSIYLIIP